MWIVRLALRRPYTFVVLALLIFILGPLVILRTPTDIFPNINIPVVSTIWNYARPLGARDGATASSPATSARLTTTVNDIEHIESQTLAGISVVKIFFRPKARIDAAVVAGDGDRADGPAADAARHDAAAHHQLQRLERAHAPARALGPGALRAAALRRRQQRRPRGARDRPGRGDPVPVRRQAAPDPGGPRSRTRCSRAGSPPPTSSTRSARRT